MNYKLGIRTIGDEVRYVVLVWDENMNDWRCDAGENKADVALTTVLRRLKT